MKFLIILFLKILLLSDLLIAETILTKPKLLKQSRECIENPQNRVCIDLVSQIEKLQLAVFDQNRFKCQSSLLGLQSELIEAYFFKKLSKERTFFMIQYVIKNC